MQTLTEDQPKCLTLLGGHPLITWQRRALEGAGLGPIGIVTGYRAECLTPFADQTFHNPEWASTNMVASLACAHEWLATEVMVVSYSDIFYASGTIRQLAEVDADIAISHAPNWFDLWSQRFADPLSDAESFAADADGVLTDIGRRVDSLAQIQGQYMGLLRIAPAGWARIVDVLDHLSPAVRARLDMTSLLRHLITGGMRIRVIANAAPWGEVDTASDLALYERQIAHDALDLMQLTGRLRS